MAPKERKATELARSVSRSDSSEGSSAGDGDSSKLLHHILQAEDFDAEEEYHTDPSEASDPVSFSVKRDVKEDGVEEEEDDLESEEDNAPSVPLLPPELLNPILPSPAYSSRNVASLPHEQMTRLQKKAERNRSRKTKKKMWEQRQRDAELKVVLKAGEAAQLRRGVRPSTDRVRKGRIAKKAKVQSSGRQKLIEERKRQIGQSESEARRPIKRPKR